MHHIAIRGGVFGWWIACAWITVCQADPATVSDDAIVNVRLAGAAGDAITDDTEAIRHALTLGTEIYFPPGVYRISDGIELPPSVTLRGAGSPKLGTFPLRDDDKRFLRDGELANLPGTTLLFTGRGQSAISTRRKDGFANLRYAVKTATGLPFQIRDLAIVMDMRVVRKNGRMTNREQDARADYDVGLLVDDGPDGTVRDVCVFGYWKQAGLCVLSQNQGSNPDYNTFWNCSFSGEYGVALVGDDTVEGAGLSGTQFYGCNLFSADHHHRGVGQWGSGALLIDGDTPSKRAEINGHYFFGGCIRTYHNVAVQLDHASNVSFHGVIFEVPGRDSPGADHTGKIVGTKHTRDVMLHGCRMHDVGIRSLGESMNGGYVVSTGGGRGGVSVHSRGGTASMQVGDQGDPMIQLSRSAQSSNDGWTVRLDASEGEALVLRHNNRQAMRVTPNGQLITPQVQTSQLNFGRAKRTVVQNGAAEATQSSLRLFLAKKSGPGLSRIHPVTTGQWLILQLDAASDPVTFGSKAGNLRLSGPMTLDHPDDRLMLVGSDQHWVEVSRSDAGPRESHQR